MALFAAIMLLAVGLVSWYVGWRLVGPLLPSRPRWGGWALTGLFALLAPASFMIMRFPDRQEWHRPLQIVGFTALGALTMLAAALIVLDLGRLLLAGLARVLPATDSPGGLSLLSPESRRLLLAGWRPALLAAVALLVAAQSLQARRAPVVEKVFVAIPGLPPALAGFTIVQLSDLHISVDFTRPQVQRLVDIANSLHPDLVAFTGDLADGLPEVLTTDAEPLAGLRSRHGAFFVTGNHEYYSDLPGWLAEVERLGMTSLLNEHRLLDHDGALLAVAGVTDLQAGSLLPSHRTDPDQALAAIPSQVTTVLLAHQPRSALRAAELGVDLVLCGHTHAGQFFPWTLLVGLVQPFSQGLHHHLGSAIYTNRGSAWWGPPLRWQAPEVTLITLTPATGRDDGE